MSTPPIKLMFVGDGAVGKNYLITRFTTGEYLNTYIPIVFDMCRHVFTVDARPAVMDIWQVGGQDDYDRLRPLSYPDTDVVLICFKIGSPSSFERVVSKWHPEICHHLPGVPIILVGLQSDLRHDVDYIRDLERRKLKLVSQKDGQKVADRIEAVEYVECSAKTCENVSAPFYAACKAVYLPKKSKHKKKVKAET